MIPDLDNLVVTNEDVNKVKFDNSVVVDNFANNKINEYIKYADGKFIEVDYYSFVRGDNDENSLIDPANETQQYQKVKGLQLTLISPLNQTAYDDLSFDVVMIETGITPAENDIMILDLMDGRKGMFKVDGINKRTYVTKRAYDFRGKFLYYSDVNKEFFDNLYSKVKKNFVFNKDSIGTNSAPLLTEEKHTEKVNLNIIFKDMLDSYLSKFIKEKILCLNDVRLGYVFDYNIQNIIVSILEDSAYSRLKIVEVYDKSNTIVDTILGKKKFFNGKEIKKYYNVNTVSYSQLLTYTLSLLSSGVEAAVSMSDTASDNPIKVDGAVNKNIPNNFRSGNNSLYLFGESFYGEAIVGIDGELSTLETLLKAYIEGKTIDSTELTKLVKDVVNWTVTEVYFYVPFLLLLIRQSLANMYSRM